MVTYDQRWSFIRYNNGSDECSKKWCLHALCMSDRLCLVDELFETHLKGKNTIINYTEKLTTI